MSRLESSHIYVVRRDGKSEFQGSLNELKAWLADRRITTDDEVRRLGYVVLEGDDLWSRVGDRKELGFNPTLVRDKLKNALRLAQISYICFFALCILAGYYLYLHQGVPRFEYSNLLNEAESRYQATLSVNKARAREAEIASKKSYEELSLKFTDLEAEHLNVLEQVKKLSSDIEMQIINFESLNANFLKAIVREQGLVDENRILRDKLDEQKRIYEENANKPSFEGTILISWGNSPFDGSRDKYLQLQNIKDVEMRVSIVVVNRGRVSFIATIPPRGLYNSSQHLSAPLLYVGDKIQLTISNFGFVREITVR
jgi:regulator of replication initiation timing